ncbi:hypothetical protein [Rhodoferax sp.]|uniref:hypothetical protein n=1 Tax=Rhodoferax sp. TaxID=50421 RepID=UPI002ACEB07D|nr:hypothetical protein [Rhodoferax sp.]MDZ7922076.1 hypothetical protein [Rhodoferax sp.]
MVCGRPRLQGLYSTWAVGVSKGTSKSYYYGDKDVELDSVQRGQGRDRRGLTMLPRKRLGA